MEPDCAIAEIFAGKVFWWLHSVEYIRSRSEGVAVTVSHTGAVSEK